MQVNYNHDCTGSSTTVGAACHGTGTSTAFWLAHPHRH
jgi:hypothetical protein